MNSPFLSCFFGIVALSLCAGCRLRGKPTEADIERKPDQVRDFAVLYAENCAGCHGLEGRGNSALGLANPVYLAIANDDVVRHATALGVHGSLMPAFENSAGGSLTREQIEILASGIRERWAKPGELHGETPPPYVASQPGDRGRGGRAYATFCAGCHGPDGSGTAKGSSIVDDSYLALVTDQNLRVTIIAGRPDLGHPDWQHCVPGKAMTPQEVTDVVAWLAAHRTANPGQPYTANEPKQRND